MKAPAVHRGTIFITDGIKDIIGQAWLKKLTTLPEFIIGNRNFFKKRLLRRGAIYVLDQYQSLPVDESGIDWLVYWDGLKPFYIGNYDLYYLNSELFQYRHYYIHTLEVEEGSDYFCAALFPLAQ